VTADARNPEGVSAEASTLSGFLLSSVPCPFGPVSRRVTRNGLSTAPIPLRRTEALRWGHPTRRQNPKAPLVAPRCQGYRPPGCPDGPAFLSVRLSGPPKPFPAPEPAASVSLSSDNRKVGREPPGRKRNRSLIFASRIQFSRSGETLRKHPDCACLNRVVSGASGARATWTRARKSTRSHPWTHRREPCSGLRRAPLLHRRRASPTSTSTTRPENGDAETGTGEAANGASIVGRGATGAAHAPAELERALPVRERERERESGREKPRGSFGRSRCPLGVPQACPPAPRRTPGDGPRSSLSAGSVPVGRAEALPSGAAPVAAGRARRPFRPAPLRVLPPGPSSSVPCGPSEAVTER
jgi:hypothetical protein